MIKILKYILFEEYIQTIEQEIQDLNIWNDLKEILLMNVKNIYNDHNFNGVIKYLQKKYGEKYL